MYRVVLLTDSHVVECHLDTRRITVYNRLTHQAVWHGIPRKGHPLSELALKFFEAVDNGEIPEDLPVWDPYPREETAAGFRAYLVAEEGFPDLKLQQMALMSRSRS